MGKVEKITIKLAMLFIGLSLLFPARVLAAEKNEINEITEKKQIIFLLDASKSMQGDGPVSYTHLTLPTIYSV